jgi:hypothetical protein
VARNSKYRLNLTTDDKRFLDYLVIRFVAESYALIQKYPDPKDYAKMALGNLQSDKCAAFFYTLTYSKSLPAGHVFTPADLNRKLIANLEGTVEQAYRSHTERFLHPRDLREAVLEKLEKRGMFIHIEKDGLIRGRRRGTLRGKRPSIGVDNYHGGRLSEYKVSEEIEKIKKFIENPVAVKYFYRGVLNSGYAHRFATYFILASFHAEIMSDEKTLHRVTAIGASFIETVLDEENYKTLYQELRRLTDKQLEEYAENTAKQILGRPEFYQNLLFTVLVRTCLREGDYA